MVIVVDTKPLTGDAEKQLNVYFKKTTGLNSEFMMPGNNTMWCLIFKCE